MSNQPSSIEIRSQVLATLAKVVVRRVVAVAVRVVTIRTAVAMALGESETGKAARY